MKIIEDICDDLRAVNQIIKNKMPVREEPDHWDMAIEILKIADARRANRTVTDKLDYIACNLTDIQVQLGGSE